MIRRLHAAACMGALLPIACAGGGSGAARNLPLGAVDAPMSLATRSPIKHVVIVIQENRSFDNLFAGYPGANAPTNGKETVVVNGVSTVKTIALRPIPLGDPAGDMGHDFDTAVTAWDGGNMDRFNENFLASTNGPVGTYPYSYVRRSDIRPYWQMARQYVLADHLFPTEWGPSFTAHQDLISGTTALSSTTSIADNPTNPRAWGCDDLPGSHTDLVTAPATAGVPGTVSAAGPFPCYDRISLAERLDAANVSWRYYAPSVNQHQLGDIWSAYDAIRSVRYGADWHTNVVSPPSTIIQDVAAGKLASVSWVVPDYLNSDHPAAKSTTGPSWVASVVNAIGRSRYWKSTAIVVLWDDWGGWYDNVSPPQLDYAGLGIRVPCIIVSPYAIRPGYVDRTQYEYGSILKFVEQTFGLQPMGTSDTRAASIVDSFDFTHAPRTFSPIAQRYSTRFFLSQKPSFIPPDSQ